VLVDPGNVVGLGDALAQLRDQPEVRSQLARGARTAAEQRFSWDHAVSQVVGATVRPGSPELPIGRMNRN